jgi:histidine triad (HIT) family protein
MKDDCIFCKINKGDIPSYTIYEDDDFRVFLDINPVTNGHCLLVPKKHYDTMFDLNEEMVSKMYGIAKKIYELEKEKLGIDGFTLYNNNYHGQDVKHYHLHLIPRYINDEVHVDSNEKILVGAEDVYNQLQD